MTAGGPEEAQVPDPDADGVIDLQGFIINDGATDNGVLLLSLRDVLHAHRGRALTLRFPAGGEVQYTNNLWLWGVGDVTIEGNGTSFRCVSDSPWSADQRPFNVKTPFNNRGDISEQEENNGRTFTVGELLSEADLSNYEGQRVLVYGYDTQQGGFPPNPRHFHYATVRGAALDPPLSFIPDDRWPEFEQFVGTIGRPRILSLERADYYHPRRIVLRNVRLPEGPSTLSADWLELEEVEADRVTFTICRDVRMRRVAGRDWEPDKIIGSLVIEDCEALEAFTEATGVRKLQVVDCSFAGDIRPRAPDMEFVRCTFAGSPESQFGIWRYIDRWAVARLYFAGCTFDATESPDLRYAINPSADDTQPALLPMIEVTEVLSDAVAVRAVGRWEGRDAELWANMMAGQALRDADVIAQGVVEGLHSGAGGRVLVRAAWEEPPQVGTIYQMWLIFGRFDGGGNQVVGRDVPLWRGVYQDVSIEVDL